MHPSSVILVCDSDDDVEEVSLTSHTCTTLLAHTSSPHTIIKDEDCSNDSAPAALTNNNNNNTRQSSFSLAASDVAQQLFALEANTVEEQNVIHARLAEIGGPYAAISRGSAFSMWVKYPEINVANLAQIIPPPQQQHHHHRASSATRGDATMLKPAFATKKAAWSGCRTPLLPKRPRAAASDLHPHTFMQQQHQFKCSDGDADQMDLTPGERDAMAMLLDVDGDPTQRQRDDVAEDEEFAAARRLVFEDDDVEGQHPSLSKTMIQHQLTRSRNRWLSQHYEVF